MKPESSYSEVMRRDAARRAVLPPFFAAALLSACGTERPREPAREPRAPAPPEPRPQPMARVGLSERASAVAFEPLGRLFATGTERGLIELRDGSSGQSVRTLRGHTRRVTGLAFSPDGRELASTSDDGTGRIWDVATGRETTPGGSPSPAPDEARAPARAVAWSPRGDLLAILFDHNGARVYDPKTGNLRAILWPWRSSGDSALAFRADGSTLAVGMQDGNVDVWNARRGMRLFTLRAHERGVTSLGFRPDGSELATAARDASLRVHALDRGGSVDLRRPEPGKAVRETFVAWSPDGQWVASGDHDGAVRRFSPDAGQEALELWPPRGKPGPNPLAWSPLGLPLVAGSTLLTGQAVRSTPAAPARVDELPAAPAVRRQGSDRVRGRINRVAFSADGKWLAASSMAIDCEVKLYDERGELFSTLDGGLATFPWSVAFTPDGKTLGRTTSRGRLELIDVATQKLRATVALGDRQSSVLAFSPDGGMVATDTGTHQPGVMLWSSRDGSALGKLSSSDCDVDRLTFSPDGSSLVVHCHAADGVRHWVELWDPRARRRLATRAAKGRIGTAFFDPKPRFWVAREEGKKGKRASLYAVELVSGRETKVLSLDAMPAVVVGDARGSLVYASEATWDTKTRARLARGLVRSPRDVSFSPDGSRIAFGQSDSLVSVVDARSGAELMVLGGD